MRKLRKGTQNRSVDTLMIPAGKLRMKIKIEKLLLLLLFCQRDL